GIFLQSKRSKRRPRTAGRSRGGPIVERGEDAAERRVPGRWEGDLIIGDPPTEGGSPSWARKALSVAERLGKSLPKHSVTVPRAAVELCTDLLVDTRRVLVDPVRQPFVGIADQHLGPLDHPQEVPVLRRDGHGDRRHAIHRGDYE